MFDQDLSKSSLCVLNSTIKTKIKIAEGQNFQDE